jgi:hypothetical protein
MHGTGYYNKGPTGKNLQQLQKHQAKVNENECSHLVQQIMYSQATDAKIFPYNKTN